MAKKKGDAVQRTSFNLPVPLLKALRHRAVDLDRDVQDLVAEAIRDYLRKGGA